MADPVKKMEEPEPTPSLPTPGAEPPGPTDELAPDIQLADSCFARAEQATVRGNFEYAIHLYLDGLRYNPRDLEHGHKGLHDCAIRRRNTGKGGGIGALFGQAKTGLSQMLGRQKDAMLGLLASLARDPQNVTLLTQMMQMARRQEYFDVAIYYGELAAEETLRSKKPQKQIFTTLADMYESSGQFQKGVDALATAIRIDPSDRALDKRARDLAAQASIEEGKLESVSDFRQMIRDQGLASKAATQQVVRTADQLETQYAELKAALDADPKNAVKMQLLADCQARRGNLGDAMALLQQALDLTGEYRYKARMDDLRMAEYRRLLREIDEQLGTEPGRADLKAKRHEIVAERDPFELAVFTQRQRQYPTDMSIRYDLGVRQYRIGQYDEAIVAFQMATRDPKRRILALNQLGKCFFAKKLLQEAQSQFETAIQQYELAGDPLGKELRYNLAMCFEAQGKAPQAIEWYSVIVQQDYQYRDAAKRLEALRRKATEGEAKA